MSIRRDPIYLSSEVWRALWVLAQARGSRTDSQGFQIMATPDEVADEFLRESITKKHPQIFEHQKEVRKMEKALIKAIGGDS